MKQFLIFLVGALLMLVCGSAIISGIVTITQGGWFFICTGLITTALAVVLFILFAQHKIIEYWGNKVYEWIFE